METMADRVERKMKALGFTQPSLAARCGVEQPQITRLLAGTVKNPSYIYELSLALETSVKWLRTGIEESVKTIPNSEQDHRSQLSGSGIPLINQERIPVYAPIPGEPENVIRFSKEYIVGYEPRPDRMQVIRDDFYVSAYDDSMAPRHYNGEDVYVHPTKPPSIGKDCVYVEEATGKVFIRVFWGETATEWKFSQLNPVKEFSIDKSEVRKIFAVLR